LREMCSDTNAPLLGFESLIVTQIRDKPEATGQVTSAATPPHARKGAGAQAW